MSESGEMIRTRKGNGKVVGRYAIQGCGVNFSVVSCPNSAVFVSLSYSRQASRQLLLHLQMQSVPLSDMSLCGDSRHSMACADITWSTRSSKAVKRSTVNAIGGSDDLMVSSRRIWKLKTLPIPTYFHGCKYRLDKRLFLASGMYLPPGLTLTLQVPSFLWGGNAPARSRHYIASGHYHWT